MPLYLVQFAYSPAAWQSLMEKPEDRTPVLESLAKQGGGRLVALYYHFGEFDGTAIFESPDDATINAAVMKVAASGGVRTTRTVRLFTPKEFVDALGRSAKLNYQTPGKK